MVGDLIRWTRTDEVLGMLSPELARVEAVVSLPKETKEPKTPTTLKTPTRELETVRDKIERKALTPQPADRSR